MEREEVAKKQFNDEEEEYDEFGRKKKKSAGTRPYYGHWIGLGAGDTLSRARLLISATWIKFASNLLQRWPMHTLIILTDRMPLGIAATKAGRGSLRGYSNSIERSRTETFVVKLQ
jgi:hypothetical protein